MRWKQIEKNRAKEIIEDFMISVNGVTARIYFNKEIPFNPQSGIFLKRWERIVLIAREHNFRLAESRNSKALEEFLITQKAKDPLRFPDLSRL